MVLSRLCQLVRSTLKRIKDDPYPAVTIFHTNSPRYYRNDTVSGHWIRVYHKEDASNGSASNTAAIAAAAAGWPPPTAAAVPSIGNTQAYY